MAKKRSSGDRATRSPSRQAVRTVLDRWAKGLDAYTVLPNPQIPNVFNQPTYLVVPRLGQLVAIFISWLPKREPYWQFVLASIEDLFEMKTISGSNTIVGLVVLSDLEDHPPLGEDMQLLLRRTFDFCHITHVSTIMNQQNKFFRELSSMFYESQAKERYLGLWDSERRTMDENLSRYDKRVVKSLLDESPYNDWPLDHVKDEIASRLRNQLPPYAEIQRNVPVFNIKHWLLDSPIEYSFSFDFEIMIGYPVLIQITKGRTSRTYQQDLRSLSAQARLIRYMVSLDGGLLPRAPDYRLWLAVTGHLRGPEHDETRYARAMIASGWHLVRADLLGAEKLLRQD
jgi:hypothetical protein